MVDLLSSNTLIAVFLVIAVGAWFGTVKFGPIRFGATGAQFLGQVIGAFVVPDHVDLTLLQNLGLGLFVYLIGLEAGEEFLRTSRRSSVSWPRLSLPSWLCSREWCSALAANSASVLLPDR